MQEELEEVQLVMTESIPGTATSSPCITSADEVANGGARRGADLVEDEASTDMPGAWVELQCDRLGDSHGLGLESDSSEADSPLARLRSHWTVFKKSLLIKLGIHQGRQWGVVSKLGDRIGDRTLEVEWDDSTTESTTAELDENQGSRTKCVPVVVR